MVSLIGYELNEINTMEEWRKYELKKTIAEISGTKNADDFAVGDVWVESVTHQNLPTDFTQGIINTRVSEPVNGRTHKAQVAIGRNTAGTTAVHVRYFNGTTWLAWT